MSIPRNLSVIAPNISTGGVLSVAGGGSGTSTSTGTGAIVLAVSPTLTTPLLGTPTSGNFSTGSFIWPTFNQNTSGTAATITGVYGGTITSSQVTTGLGFTPYDATNPSNYVTVSALASYAPLTSPSLVTPILGTPQSGNFSTGTFTWPTFNQNTSGTASNVTGIVAIANGGTGADTATGSGAVVLSTSPTFTNSIGINAVPSSLWNSNASNLIQFNTTTAIYTYFGNLNFTSNVLWKDDGSYYYVQDGTATRYSHFDGNHRFYNAVAGLAGDVITFTQPMTLKANGSLNLTSLTASSSVATDASQNLISVTNTGTGNNVLATSPTITTPTISGITLNDGYTEEVYAVVDAAGVALSPTNGSIQTWTLAASRTPTAGTWAAGQSITLMIDDGTAYTVTWTSLAVTWKTNSGAAPTLNTTGYTPIVLWKVGAVIYGARAGDA